MEISQLFNILLLALSLATILLTLISYRIYRAKQLPPSTSRKGIFADVLPNNVFVFFVVTSCVIFACLILQVVLSKVNTKSNAMIPSAYLKLSPKSLSKSYDFDPTITQDLLIEEQPENLMLQNRELASTLAKHNVLLYRSAKNDELNAEASASALKGWKELLLRYGLAAKETLSLRGVDSGDLVLLPQMKALSKEDKKEIDQAIENGASFVATGAVGMLDGHREVSHSDWSEKTFGVQLQASDPKIANPTMFSGKAPALWGVPPGLLIDSFPTDSSYRALPVFGASVAFEADNQGELRTTADETPFTRAQLVELPKARTVWLALDPHDPRDLRDIKDNLKDSSLRDAALYLDNAFLYGCAWAARAPLARVAMWKGAKQSAVVVSIDAEDKFENVANYLGALRRSGYPATFFTASQLYAKFPKMFSEKLADGSIEVASHSEDNADLEGQPASTQFTRMQASRLVIESLTEKPVVGFRPPNEKFDNATVNAAVQNRLKYFSGNNRFTRFAPVWIAGGKLLYFPRVALDDYLIGIKMNVRDPARVSELLERDFRRILAVGGAYFLSTHTQVFGRPEYIGPLERSLVSIGKLSVWKTNYDDLTEWWRSRSAVTVELEKSKFDPTSYVILAKNNSDAPTTELDVEYDLGNGQAGTMPIDPLEPNSTREYPERRR